MEKKEVLDKVNNKKTYVGEMEKSKMGKGNWLAVLVAGVLAVAFIVAECAQGHFAGGMALACACYTWACVQYTLQYTIYCLLSRRMHGCFI